MSDHELDRILSEQDELVPSSGFVKGVMDGIRTASSAPPPIPFPWQRALPGLVVSILFLTAACVMGFLRQIPPRAHQASGPSIFMRVTSDLGDLLSAAKVGGLGWIVLALLLTFASVKVSFRFGGSKI
jgi:hypothetical protein